MKRNQRPWRPREIMAISRSLRRPLAVMITAAGVATAGDVSHADEAAFLAGAAKSCAGCALEKARLKGRDLAGADLSGAKLVGAVFHRARLTGANLAGADLAGANLNKTDLKNAS